jgi:prophage maintenance system killer protein
MSDLMQWLNEELGEKESSLVVLAALFHYKFIRIHPFDDGNGRLARILMNLLLMRGGYPPAIVKSNNKDAYYTALQKADGGDEQSFVSHIASVLKYSMILYLKGASGEDIEEVDDVDKEFELLKMMVEGKDENIVLSPNTISLILDETIAPLLDQLSKKVFKCNEFYHKHAFGCGIENLNGERLVKGERKFEKVDSLNSFFKEIKTVFREGMKLALSFQWQDFKREKDGIKKYNYYLKLEIRFGDTYCTLNQLKEGKLISLQRYYYHKNIEEPSKEVANKLLKEFMTHIKNNMAE